MRLNNHNKKWVASPGTALSVYQSFDMMASGVMFAMWVHANFLSLKEIIYPYKEGLEELIIRDIGFSSKFDSTISTI